MPNWGIQSNLAGGATARHSLGANGDFAFGTGDFTIEVAFKPPRFTVSDANAAYASGMYLPLGYYFLYFGSSSVMFNANQLGYGIGNHSSSPWSGRFACRDASGTSNLSAGDLTIATNYRSSGSLAPVIHLTGTRSGVNGYYFIDGVYKATGSTTTVANITGASTKILFGGTHASTYLFIRISNIARSAEWLRSHYQDKFYTDANVVGLYNFSTEKGLGTTIYDTSGNNRHGVLDTNYGKWVKVSNAYEGQKMPAYSINDMAGQVADVPLITKGWSVVNEVCQAVEGSPSYKTVYDYPNDTTFRIADATYAMNTLIQINVSTCRVLGKWFAAKTITAKSNDGTYTTLTVASHGCTGQAGGAEFLKIN